MSFGGWAISEDLYRWLVDHVPEGATVLELGSGDGDRELANRWQLWTVEHDETWLGLVPGVNYIHAPLRHGWYDTAMLSECVVNLRYDVLLVDGPPRNMGRANFLPNMSLFSASVPWVFDDLQETATLRWVAKVAGIRGEQVHEHRCSDGKSFGVIAGEGWGCC